jgi:hypothetical protein
MIVDDVFFVCPIRDWLLAIKIALVGARFARPDKYFCDVVGADLYVCPSL